MTERRTIVGLPSLTWLRAFEAAARAESFTAAARELGLTQAAISYQVRLLEDHLGWELFERLPRGVRLTAMGIAYLAPVRKAFDELAISTLGLFGSNQRASISVLAPVSFGSLWLAPRLPDFFARYPNIEVRLSATIWGNTGSNASIDLEIRYGDGKVNGRANGGTGDALLHQDLVIACSPQYLRDAGFDGDVQRLVQKGVVHIMGHEDHWLKPATGIAGADIGAAPGPTVDTTIAGLELAANHAGCVVTHPLFLASYLGTGRLVLPSPATYPDDQGFHLFTPERPQRTRREVHVFREWLLGAAAAEGALRV
jgi:LysR family glycine cleavage system transcriptional activator